MPNKAKNHFVPDFIIRRFSKLEEEDIPRISFLQKSTGTIQKDVIAKLQCQKKYFYSKEKIEFLLNKFKHVILNPIFKYPDKTLEDNLELCVETPFGNILSQFEKGDIKILIDNVDFLKNYFLIQFIRTQKYKDSINEIKQFEEFPEHDFEEAIMKNLKEAPFPKGMINNPIYKKLLKKRTRKAKKNFLTYSDFVDRHSVEVLCQKSKDNFFTQYSFNDANMTLLQNETNIPFILSDWGVLVTRVIKTYDDRTESKEYEFYLSINPKLIIMFSKKVDIVEKLSEKDIIEINKLFFDECFDLVYSSEDNYLEKLKLSH